MHPANKWLIGAASAALISGAALWEGTKYVPYRDLGGVLTVCMGYTGKDIVVGKRYTDAECKQLLRTELASHGKGVLSCTTRPLKQNEYEAYTLFAYNVGVAGFCNSTSAKLFNAGRNKEACDRLAFTPNGQPNWSYVNGKFIKGLHNRRLFERQKCLGNTIEYKS